MTTSNYTIEQWIELIDKKLIDSQREIDTLKVQFESLKELKEKSGVGSSAH